MPFAGTWKYLNKKLLPGTKIQLWTTLRGWGGKQIEIVSVTPDSIIVKIGNGKKRTISKDEFSNFYANWESLWKRGIKITSLTKAQHNASYVVSIYFWVHCTNGSQLP